MSLTDTAVTKRETLSEREVRGEELMAGRDLPGPDVTGQLGSRLARVPEWQRERLVTAMTQLLGDLLLGNGERVVGLVEVVERQVGENRYEYRAQSMNVTGQVVAGPAWSRTRAEAVQAYGELMVSGGGVTVAHVCRRCFEELPPLEAAGSRFACRCGQVYESSRYGAGWRPLDGR